MAETILVPVDGSDPATAAVSFAIDKFPDAHFRLFHAANPPDIVYGSGPEDLSGNFWAERVETAKTQSDEILSDAKQRVDEAGIEVECDSEIGPPTQLILDAIEARNVDHVIMGSHGRSGLSRVFLGSVAEKVVRRAPVPVTIVHGDER